MILFIDPGKSLIGYSITDDTHTILDCGVQEFKTHFELSEWLKRKMFSQAPNDRYRAFCEKPQAYRTDKQDGEDQNDLIDVAITAGTVAALLPNVALVRPHRWKGTVPKDIHNTRVLEGLAKRVEGAEMLRRLAKVRQTIRHNAIDAVGLSLWWESEGVSS